MQFILETACRRHRKSSVVSRCVGSSDSAFEQLRVCEVRFVRRSVGGFSVRLPHLFAVFVSLPLVTASEMLLRLSSSEVLHWFSLGEGLLEDDSKKTKLCEH